MKKEKRLIEYAAVYQYAFNGVHGGRLEDEDFSAIIQAIDAVSTVDAVEVVHARWIDAREYYGDYMCSNCDSIYGTNKFNYCPHCGAKMDGERKTTNGKQE